MPLDVQKDEHLVNENLMSETLNFEDGMIRCDKCGDVVPEAEIRRASLVKGSDIRTASRSQVCRRCHEGIGRGLARSTIGQLILGGLVMIVILGLLTMLMAIFR